MSKNAKKPTGKNFLTMIAQAEEDIKKNNPAKITTDAHQELQEKITEQEAEPRTIIQEEVKEVVTPVIENNLVETIVSEKSRTVTSFENIFEKRDHGVGEQQVRIPTDIHFSLKLLSTHSKTPISTLIANILDDFLKTNAKEIKAKSRSKY